MPFQFVLLVCVCHVCVVLLVCVCVCQCVCVPMFMCVFMCGMCVCVVVLTCVCLFLIMFVHTHTYMHVYPLAVLALWGSNTVGWRFAFELGWVGPGLGLRTVFVVWGYVLWLLGPMGFAVCFAYVWLMFGFPGLGP